MGTRYRLLLWTVAVFAAAANGAGLYSASRTTPIHAKGEPDHAPTLELPMRFEGGETGRLVLGARRGGQHYTERDRRALEQTLGAVAEALSLALELGHADSLRERYALTAEPVS